MKSKVGNSKVVDATVNPTQDETRRNGDLIKTALWSAVSFVLCIASSAVGGRSLWCDEILRVNGQHYSVADLLAFKHLHDFCTQTPTAYLFMRPFQLLLGYEFGGCLVSALAGAATTAATLRVVRRLHGNVFPSWFSAIVVASNPLLVYYGSELGFYGMWGAAFACSFAILASWHDGAADKLRSRFVRGLLLAVSGSLFVTFHFAGIFIWTVVAAVALLIEWAQSDMKRTASLALPLSIPVLANLEMYLESQDKAIHLGTQAFDFSKAAGLPRSLFHYVCTLFPSFTGGWIIGVALCIFGVFLLCRRAASQANRRIAFFSIASILSVLLFLAYSGLRSYMPNVARYWIFALAPALALTAFGIEECIDIAKRKSGVARLLVIAPTLVFAANMLADSSLLSLDGRIEPFKYFQKALEGDIGKHNGLIYPNHYETRFLGGYYKLPSPEGALYSPVFPCYWEQGDTDNSLFVAGIRAAHELSPLMPAYITTEKMEKMARDAGLATTNAIAEIRPKTLDWTCRLHLFPEFTNVPKYLARILAPTLDEAIAQAEKNGAPLIIPSATWAMRRQPPKSAGKPFAPFLLLSPGVEAAFDIYIPSAWNQPAHGAAHFNLVAAAIGESTSVSVAQTGCEPVSIALAKAIKPISVSLSNITPGAWTSVAIKSADASCAVFSTKVAAIP